MVITNWRLWLVTGQIVRKPDRPVNPLKIISDGASQDYTYLPDGARMEQGPGGKSQQFLKRGLILNCRLLSWAKGELQKIRSTETLRTIERRHPVRKETITRSTEPNATR
jgi:hypothetical protein